MADQSNRSLNEIIQHSSVRLFAGRYAVLQMRSLPQAIDACFMVTQDGDEVTVIVESSLVQLVGDYEQSEKWFRLIELQVSLPFYAVGFLARVTGALALRGIAVLVISTYSKDFLLIREDRTQQACAELKELGFIIGKTCEGKAFEMKA